MINYLQDILFQGRNNDYEVILNILFVVVMVVFWIVGSIVKNKIKTSDGEDKKEPQRKSAKMPTSIGKAFWEQFIELSQNPQPKKKILPVKAIVSEKSKPKSSRIKETAKSPQASNDAAKESSLPTITIPQQETFDISFDEIEPDEIKRAILYTEILGKPVSMRNPS